MSTNRECLTDVALRLFAARGYEAVGVQEIVAAAGITKPTLYHYFGSKKGLLAAMLTERLEPLGAQLRAVCARDDELPLTLNRVTRTFFDFAAAHPDLYRIVLSLSSAPPDSEAAQVFAPLARSWHERLERLFAAATNTRVRTRAAQLAATFSGMIHTWIALALQGHATLDDELTFQAVHQYLHGIYS